MAFEVVWTEAAQRDRDSIVAYIVEVSCSPAAATKLLDEIDRMAELLADNPETCAKALDEGLAARGYRTCPVLRYVLLYKRVGNAVVFMRMFHGSQDYARLV